MWPPELLADMKNAPPQHPGLRWRFGAWIRLQDAATYRDEHVRNTVLHCKGSAQHAGAYRRAFARRKSWLDARAVVESLEIDGRLFTGVGEPGVFECQAAMHPVTGMPRVPGSSIKGSLKHWAFERHGRLVRAGCAAAFPLSDLEALFGKGDDYDLVAGCLIVHDAWWDPDSLHGPLAVGRATPHHPRYDAGKAREASDLDEPNPVPQLAIAGRLQFAIDHHMVGVEWAARCMDWLIECLRDGGMGARTAAGFGRFKLDRP